ncbi:hypothetical protein [Phytoactinopolyspora mesophila]|uniref:DUF3558 domain-containing protein n=1 Tax=Phytoactinopolyspora mesophila TaxID=2650750 RepID=A0A7K3M2N5_9ACTN|nr:hypothetical protein [Phytoactinopolyspora mesophila]NDL57563.1 hypothetical protein [Phytoactinopolyspora mesophila]
MRLRQFVIVAVAPVFAGTLAACGGDDDATPSDPTQAMFDNLPDCDRVPMDEAPEVEPDVSGLVLPEGARITSVLEQGPLTSVEGTIRMTPLDVRADYEQRDDVELLRIEDEVFEAEVLIRAAGQRMYLLAAALCADGTSLSVVIGPDTEDADLPEFRSDLE